ncbi:pseudouridine synthase [Alteromonas gilva]|uniref:Ribosomal small subunit pseudouridine synthase A n=1 Tax=Alteromonas gilva TaxID=2987522 RepID=A0ABT5L5D4_9ALTE|nr:pseudouridine synthase [Alteromonas gilva]MDC8831609.1 pseudouridine synthase [Alteromonas gilva]
MRLDKFICKSTQLSQAEALACINRGEVDVNGLTITNAATQVHENNLITLKGVTLTARASRYILLHKPASTICSNKDEHYPSVLNLLNLENQSQLHIAGRLDADSTGMILITDDGRWTYNITHPSRQCRKVYRVRLSSVIAENLVDQFRQGVKLQGEAHLTRPAELEILAPREARLVITEGKFHQVKRMFFAVGNRVVALHREAIGPVSLDVEEGQWRYLTQHEVQSLRQ